ncbi:hypothetical protein ACQPU1_09115 [Clostridium paraputrificum]|uniref:hypothetical protein n=1 Tax=Clostridium TaxID=1485 RepID=UPI003D3338F8
MRRIVNTCNIDTIYGNRTINLIREDIVETKGELIIFSTHDDINLPIDGEVYQSLKKRYKLRGTGRGNMTSEINGVKLQYWREKNEDDWQGFLMVRIPKLSENQNSLSAHDRHIKAIFSSVMALEFNDIDFDSISLPMIAGNTSIDYFESVKIQLKYAIKFLKESKNTDIINFYILEKEKEDEWSKAFEKTLGRTYYKQGSIVAIESLILALKDTINKIFDSERFSELEYILRIINRELEEVDSLSMSNIAINSRKISEIVAKEVASRKNININKVKYDLSSILNVISSKEILAPWIIQYLHSARVFGNRSAHVETDVKFIPIKFYDSDFISILSSLYNILNFWYYNRDDL